MKHLPSRPTIVSLLLGLIFLVGTVWDWADHANALQTWLTQNHDTVLGRIVEGAVANGWLFIALALFLWWHEASMRKMFNQVSPPATEPAPLKAPPLPKLSEAPQGKVIFGPVEASKIHDLRTKHPDRTIIDDDPLDVMRRFEVYWAWVAASRFRETGLVLYGQVGVSRAT